MSQNRSDVMVAGAGPTELVAARYSLHDGGRIIIRPGGYVGDLTASAGPYFSLLAG